MARSVEKHRVAVYLVGGISAANGGSRFLEPRTRRVINIMNHRDVCRPFIALTGQFPAKVTDPAEAPTSRRTGDEFLPGNRPHDQLRYPD